MTPRDTFRNDVFKRDSFKCVICQAPAQDAHHIMERRLFDDGGYDINNGASLCGACHLLAEQTLISPAEIRKAANIQKIILPPHLYPDYEYTKWGDIQNPNGSRYRGELFYDSSVQTILSHGKVLGLYSKYVKYPRTYHLPFSLGRTDDDKALTNCDCFNGVDVVITTKMDGECTTGYWDGHIHARAINSESHISRTWVHNHLAQRLHELPDGWRICGENLYAKHSIHYKDLISYFMVYSIWNDKNECLSWDDTLEWSALLNLTTVPPLYRGIWNTNTVQALAEHVTKNHEYMEGFVVRKACSFSYGNFRRSVAKFVRQNHVQTNKHWLKTALVKNELQPHYG